MKRSKPEFVIGCVDGYRQFLYTDPPTFKTLEEARAYQVTRPGRCRQDRIFERTYTKYGIGEKDHDAW